MFFGVVFLSFVAYVLGAGIASLIGGEPCAWWGIVLTVIFLDLAATMTPTKSPTVEEDADE